MITDSVNIRELALGILLAVTKDGEYSHIALAAVLEKYQYLSKKERSFLTRLTEGTLEKQIEMDYILNQFSKTKVNKMKPVIRCILRMGVYQLKYMDSVPSSAACNESVRLAERKGFRNLKGFVNGVLRNVSRNLTKISYPDKKEAPLYAMSIQYSIPEWMLAQWSRDYGMEKAESIAASFGIESKICIRTNLMKTTPEQLMKDLEQRGITAEPVVRKEYPDFSYGMYLSGYDHLTAIPEFAEGKFMVQDVCSMLVTHIADPRPGDYVIDVCSAPGGKSLHAAERMRGEGMVEARDLTDYKVALIEENIKKSGMKNIRAVQKDARMLDLDSIDKADLIIADLPCSGLGTLRRKTDIRFRMTEEDEKSLALLQREILSVVCQYVKCGGILIYSTCTMDRMENEENIKWFLEKNPQFSLEMQRQFFPDEGMSDGFYIAKLIRKQVKS